MNQKAERVILVCNVCQEMEHVVHCRACGLPVCSKHRAGLGALDEGYFCTETGACGLFGFGGTPAPAAEASHVRARPYRTSSADMVLVGLVIGLILVVFGYLLADSWHAF